MVIEDLRYVSMPHTSFKHLAETIAAKQMVPAALFHGAHTYP